MIRKNFYLTESQEKWLIKSAEKTELSEAEVLRRALDYIISRKDLKDDIMYRRK